MLTAIATIQAIVVSPVWVTPNLGSPQLAQLNQAMAYGDQIRTEDEALAEVGLVTGAVFRIGGNAALTLPIHPSTHPPTRYPQPASTSLPIVRPDSTWAWA